MRLGRLSLILRSSSADRSLAEAFSRLDRGVFSKLKSNLHRISSSVTLAAGV